MPFWQRLLFTIIVIVVASFFCGSDLAQTIRLRFAQLCRRCHRRSDSATLLGAIETQGVEGELTKLRARD